MKFAEAVGYPSSPIPSIAAGTPGAKNPPAWVGAGSAAGSFVAAATTTMSPTVPTVAVGNLLLAVVTVRSLSDTIATPAGWTLVLGPIDSHAALPVRTYIWRRVATGSDAVTFTKTGTGGTWRGIILGFSGTAGVGNSASSASSGTSEPVLPSITPPEDNCLVVGIAPHQVTSATMATPPAGHTKQVDSASVNIPNLIVTTRIVASAAASGTINFDINGSGGGWTAHQVSLLPA